MLLLCILCVVQWVDVCFALFVKLLLVFVKRLQFCGCHWYNVRVCFFTKTQLIHLIPMISTHLDSRLIFIPKINHSLLNTLKFPTILCKIFNCLLSIPIVVPNALNVKVPPNNSSKVKRPSIQSPTENKIRLFVSGIN